MIVVEIDTRDYERAATAFVSAVGQGAQRATLAEAETSRQRIASGAYWAPRSGRTGQSFQIDRHPEQLGATLQSGSRVARFLLDGTAPHTITPRRASVLRFVPDGGGVAFARRVQHPGTKPRPYLAAEAARAELSLARRVDLVVEEAARAAGF